MHESVSELIKPGKLTFLDFEFFEGEFLNESIAKDISIANFEYYVTSVDMKEKDFSDTGYIALTSERISVALEREKRWRDGNLVVAAHPDRFAMLITETPIMELSDKLPQFIVPDTWEFMHQVGSYLREGTSIPVVAITGSVGKTSTRVMIQHILEEDFQVLSNNDNHNTRIAIPLYMTKMVQSPDVLSLEVSLNALNDRGKGPQSTFIQPTISLITAIGEAHMSTMSDLNGLARFKANVFKGLTGDKIAIINKDIASEQLNLIMDVAKEKANEIFTYSLTDFSADLYLVSMKELKDLTEVTVSFKGELYTYYLGLGSHGMVQNSLAVLLVLFSLNLDIDKYLPRFLTFRSLPKIMERKRGYIDGKKVDIIDDTHNAAIPSMINGISEFTNKVSYYSGKKILALGQVADLGKYAKELHKELLPYINNSGADILLGYGEEMKDVVLNCSIPAQWFEDMDTYVGTIKSHLTSNSLILLKGSVSGSDYNKISSRLDAELIRSLDEEV